MEKRCVGRRKESLSTCVVWQKVLSDYYYDYIPEVSSFVAVVGVGADIFDAQARRAGLLHFFYF